MNKFFLSICDCIRRKKALFVFLVVATIVVLVLAVYGAMNFGSSSIAINLTNVPYIKFLKGGGFMSFIFGTIITAMVFYLLIYLTCCKKFLIPFAMLFYLYFVYSQVVIFTCIMLIYGFFNALILLFVLLFFLFAEFLVFILIIIEFCNLSNCPTYFKDCFKSQCNAKLLSIILLCLLLIFCNNCGVGACRLWCNELWQFFHCN